MRSEERYHFRRLLLPHYEVLAKAIISLPGTENIASVMDIGCSVGALLRDLQKLRKWNNVLGVDSGGYARKWQCYEGLYHDCDVEQSEIVSPLKFNLIICMEVLEHLHRWDNVLNSVSKLSVQGKSRFIVSVARQGQPGDSGC